MPDGRPLRVMLLSPYYPPHLGGVQAYVRGLAHELTTLDCDVVVVTSGERRISEWDGPVRVERMATMATAYNTPVDPRWPVTVRSLIRQHRPDVLNAHTPVPFLVDVAAWVRGRLPLAVTYHAVSLRKLANPVFNALATAYTAAENVTLNRSALVITVSEPVTEALEARRLRPPISLVPNSVRVGSNPFRRPRGGEGLVFISSLDRSHDWKGLGYLLEAVGLLGREPSPPRLTVVGDGSEMHRFRETARRVGADHLVDFVGARFGPDKDAVLSRADLLVAYPDTSNDAFPTVFLEAWNNGVPVVTADLPPMPAILRPDHDAVLVAPADPVALAQSLRRVMADAPLRERLARNGFRRLQERHDWRVNARVTRDLLAGLAG